MMRTHYIDVRDRGGAGGSPHPGRHYDIAAMVLLAIHGENVRRRPGGTAPGVAVAFPGLVNGDVFPVGHARAFGTEEEIRSLARTLRDRLGGRRSVDVGEVSSAPSTAKSAAFVRDRRDERETVAFHERALRRAQRKAMDRVRSGAVLERDPAGMDIREAHRLRLLQAGPQHVSRNMSLRSRSNGNGFSLWVTAVGRANGDADGDVDSYGLSRMGSTVSLPHF